MFLYIDAVSKIPFLQNREDYFYLNCLEKFEYLKFPANSIILRKNSRPDEVFFILKGSILNTTSSKIFRCGTMIGETDLYFKRERVEEYRTMTKVLVLKLKNSDFQSILNSFEDIKEDIAEIAENREKMRLIKL